MTDTGYVQAITPNPGNLLPEVPEYLGAALITGGSTGGPKANGNTLAHELAHLILDSDHVDEWGGVNVLYTFGKPETSLVRKRFNDAQIDSLRSSKNRFAERERHGP
jgi:hypothetical protein